MWNRKGGKAMDWKQILLIFMLGMSLLINNGCPAVLIGAGGAAGAGTYAYIGGESRSTEEVSLERAWDATKKAVHELGFTVTRKEKDAYGSEFQLIAYGAGEKKIVIKLKKQSSALTEIAIRVGMFGDESLSRSILEKIKGYF
jgi:hypothetical protein